MPSRPILTYPISTHINMRPGTTQAISSVMSMDSPTKLRPRHIFGGMSSARSSIAIFVTVICLSLQMHLASALVQKLVPSGCCSTPESLATNFCKAFTSFNPEDQAELRQLLGSKCDEAAFEQSTVQKRKPNFIRYGKRSTLSSDPNFLRFGRSNALSTLNDEDIVSILAMDKRVSTAANANFLRFGKSADPNFLRFGKRSPSAGDMTQDSAEPNFLRFGRKLPNNNFLRFGRSPSIEPEKFDREYRKPNFLRFG
ncbi:FMRFamide-like neuropeptide 1 [Ditylenchus destructor]|uniref:FMRFamide-like neuropeptide 1 n=1 Tax=Ditylenchus destructor TaxID=166010 RepID=A0AAD4N8V1_9BILA|nr:FMRFamide-like neuropeptide 1 [Ditylenchus destructor]